MTALLAPCRGCHGFKVTDLHMNLGVHARAHLPLRKRNPATPKLVQPSEVRAVFRAHTGHPVPNIERIQPVLNVAKPTRMYIFRPH